MLKYALKVTAPLISNWSQKSSLLPILESGHIIQKLNKADFLTFHGRIEFANVVVVTQLMMHAISFLSVISLRMTEIYFSTLTLKLSTLIFQQIFLSIIFANLLLTA